MILRTRESRYRRGLTRASRISGRPFFVSTPLVEQSRTTNLVRGCPSVRPCQRADSVDLRSLEAIASMLASVGCFAGVVL